jgi:hypothetical protein
MMVVRIITARYGDSFIVARLETRTRWQQVKIGKTRDRVAIFAAFLRSAREIKAGGYRRWSALRPKPEFKPRRPPEIA